MSHALKRQLSLLKNKIQTLKRKVNSTRGNVFKKHTYKPHALIRELESLESFAGNVQNLVQRWVSAGAISNAEYRQISAEIEEIQYELDTLRSDVEYREETFWESVRKPIIKVIQKMASIFSLIPSGFLGGADTIRRIGRD